MPESEKSNTWTDINLLWQDMMQYAKNNPTVLFCCSDNPLCDSMGWEAFHENSGIEKRWEISLLNGSQTIKRCKDKKFEQLLSTVRGRRIILNALIAEARHENPKKQKTLFDYVMED